MDRNGAISRLGPVGTITPPSRQKNGLAVPEPALPAAPLRGGEQERADILAMAAELSAMAPPVDHSRVAALREAIASGRYSINLAATALALARAAEEQRT